MNAVDGRFKSEYNLNRHIKKHVQKESQPLQSYKCSYCDLTFTKKQQLRKHEFVVPFPSLHPQLHTGIKPYPCSFPGCFQAFFSQARLTIHEKTHKEGSECVCSVTGCNFSTSNVDEFKKHLEMVHRIVKRSETTANPRILCTVPGCGHTFISVVAAGGINGRSNLWRITLPSTTTTGSTNVRCAERSTHSRRL